LLEATVNSALSGHTVLVVEDEPLIALDIVDAIRSAGAVVLTAHGIADGLLLATHPDLSAAVLDLGLSDGIGTQLCEALNQRQVPFVLHSGYADMHDVCRSGIVVPKPAAPYQIVVAVEKLVRPS
jgi:DNA-binding response OmpR family regulator